MGMIKGAIEREGLMDTSSLSGAETSDASGDGPGNQDGDAVSEVAGASQEESTREDSPMPQEGGLIAEMERDRKSVV